MRHERLLSFKKKTSTALSKARRAQYNSKELFFTINKTWQNIEKYTIFIIFFIRGKMTVRLIVTVLQSNKKADGRRAKLSFAHRHCHAAFDNHIGSIGRGITIHSFLT